MAPRVSLAIITLNEANCIERCIGSCRGLADEVVVVDSGSTDGTVERARALGARVELHPFDHFGAQKNRAVDLARGDWILNLDADEWLGDDLRAAIAGALAAPEADLIGWSFPRHNRICGRWPRFGGWRERSKFRLWRRGAVRWAGSVHEWGEPQLPGRIGRLAAPLLHDLGDDWHAYLRSQAAYADRQARQMAERGRHAGPLAPQAHAAWAFVRSLVFQGGLLMGGFGWRTAHARGSYTARKWRTLRASMVQLSVVAMAAAACLSRASVAQDDGMFTGRPGAVTTFRPCDSTHPPANFVPRSVEFPHGPWRGVASGSGQAPAIGEQAVPGPGGQSGARNVAFDAGGTPSREDVSLLELPMSVRPGQAYTFSFSVRGPEGSFIACRAVAGAGYSRIPLNGRWQRVSITEVAGTQSRTSLRIGLAAHEAGEPTLPGRVEVQLWGPQLEATRRSSPYSPTTGDEVAAAAAGAALPLRLAAPDTPRWECVGSEDGAPKLLVEGAAVNLLRWSARFDRSPWRAEGLMRIVPAGTGPIGLPGARRLVESDGSGTHGVEQSFECQAGPHTASIFLRAGARTSAELLLGVPGAAASMRVDLRSPDPRGPPTGDAANGITAIGEGWVRVSVTATATVSGIATVRLRLLQSHDGSPEYVGDGKGWLSAWGAQVEPGPRATSHIPTFYVPETRGADVMVTGPAPAARAH